MGQRASFTSTLFYPKYMKAAEISRKKIPMLLAYPDFD